MNEPNFGMNGQGGRVDWSTGKVIPPAYDENDPEFADIDELYQKVNKAQIRNSVSNNLRQWSRWRTDYNNALIEKISTLPPTRSSYLEAKSTFNPPEDSRVASVHSLMEYSASDKNLSSMPPSAYCQFGIPRVKTDHNGQSSSKQSKDYAQIRQHGQERIAASMGNLSIGPPASPDPEDKTRTPTVDYFRWPTVRAARDAGTPKNRRSSARELFQYRDSSPVAIGHDGKPRYSLQDTEWDSPPVHRDRRGSGNNRPTLSAEPQWGGAPHPPRGKHNLAYILSTPNLSSGGTPRRRSSQDDKGAWKPATGENHPQSTKPGTRKNSLLDELKDFVSPITGLPPKTPPPRAAPKKEKPTKKDKKETYKVAQQWGGVAESAYDLVKAGGQDW